MMGFGVNDSSQKYQLRTLPGRFSGLHMVCLMYAAFKITDPTADIGFDLAKEYAMADQMRRDRRNSGERVREFNAPHDPGRAEESDATTYRCPSLGQRAS